MIVAADAIDSFTVTVTDDAGNTATQVISVTITGTNDAPVATADTASATEAGGTANGSGVLSLPLVLPLRAALSSGAALAWSAPTATWQLAVDQIDFDYYSYQMQDGIEVPLREVY